MKIMAKLIVLVKPLIHVMVVAILLGVLGYLCAISLTVLAAAGLLTATGVYYVAPLKIILTVLVVAAVIRGFLHYGEQACNHYIAFKLLALIRHQVFAALRRLCPAKLDGQERGNLISIITTDIELLEVFYAHTISPIAIAVITTIVMETVFFQYHWTAGVLALLGYLFVGLAIPLWNGKKTEKEGMEFRQGFGSLNSFVLDSLRGMTETIQYGTGQARKDEIEERSDQLAEMQQYLKKQEGLQRGITNGAILIFDFAMLFLCAWLYRMEIIEFDGALLCSILMMSSFGPVVALSSLSNNLNQTLASGVRVLALLEEEPLVEEVEGKRPTEFDTVCCDGISFSYKKAVMEDDSLINANSDCNHGREEAPEIFRDYSIEIPKGSSIGIHGASGSGKSTLLKLIMRFYDVDSGTIKIGTKEIRDINTADLRHMESYVTQETSLFHDSIANNIAIGRLNAKREEIIEAAKKASIHDFIVSLPKGYDTKVGELGDTLSGGEKQRIGIARAFLHDGPMILLDEPTSNLDSFNEAIIIKTLQESCKDKTVVLVSHRESTMSAVDKVFEM